MLTTSSPENYFPSWLWTSIICKCFATNATTEKAIGIKPIGVKGLKGLNFFSHNSNSVL